MFEEWTYEAIDNRIEAIEEKVEGTNLGNSVKALIVGIATFGLYFLKGVFEGIIIIGSIWGYIQVFKFFRNLRKK